MAKATLKFDQIGYWSEIKLDIIREYASAYSKILSNQRNISHAYIDAFAGAGKHISKISGDFVEGSPTNALKIEPPFEKYYLIDLDSAKVEHLREVVGHRPDVKIFEGDCNRILLEEVFPENKYKDFKRALCILDPYGLHLNWEVIKAAGEDKGLEIFLNFPVADMNRNALWKNPENVPQSGIERMNAFWGDESWREAAYRTEDPDMFGYEEKIKRENDEVAELFRRRLEVHAGFTFVPSPIPMRNTREAIVYYLFFASHNKTGQKIVKDIFKKYENYRGER